ncbi:MULTISPECIES: AfsA-related hotdog domain-containing protein [unclassified Corynebacterium]|uniref:AfsA-related hotdog domain-containing protein n=1 Tax=unclassified Corynebacterium TaxID=2624378 RepID=UPI0029CA37B3|nr:MULTISPECIES: AfsA-related hotdog domain-containing protein [unclassified Corynebacterium]WPF66033.1 AfsA-related hotdog domain-containing protein [Corynebacterium sp. 22KM0430]WPF68526.1 AfsA-related hotdog domain-containing protein [Corynebacterium sp. 21KM1197]
MSSTTTSPLSHSTLVPREKVHRDALSEVYLTDIICDRFPHFRVGIHLPKSHSYYSDHIGLAEDHYDPLLLLETFRQTSILITHTHLNVDLNQAFIFNYGELHVSSHEATQIRVSPGNGEISATITDEKKRGDETIGITLDMTCILHGRTAATMKMIIQWMPKNVWTRIRNKGRERIDLPVYSPNAYPDPSRSSHALPGAHIPEVLGRRIDRNIVLGGYCDREEKFQVDILVDQHHPSLFDHPLDHIPGAVLFEALRQAGILFAHEKYALSARRLLLQSLAIEFLRFGELDLHTKAIVREKESTAVGFTVSIDLVQEDETIARGEANFTKQPILGSEE